MLLITIAFLRFYDQTDFEFLGLVANPRQWSNGFTVAALLATLANFGVEWNRRNRETNRLAQEAQRRVEEEQRRNEAEERRAEEEKRRIREEQRRVAQERADESRRAEERERQIARTRIETRCRIAEIQFQLDPSDQNQRALREALAMLAEYGDLFS
ncbi:hypothetical protein NON20_03395 [Synechocystis sp. B12]|nr:hypothetical protein NON20_03395 [Synechocystis sp. B12]